MSKEGATAGVVHPPAPSRDHDAELRKLIEDNPTMTVTEIQQRTRMIENENYALKQTEKRLKDEVKRMKEETKINTDRIKLQNQLPYLISTVVEIFDAKEATGYEGEEDGAAVDETARFDGKSAVIKTSTRQTIFLPVIGIVDPETLKPGDLVGVNRDSYIVLDTLPAEYDNRVKAMEIEEKPKASYGDVGGLEKQIRELVEAVVLPIQHKDRYKAIGIQPPKGVLMYGCPGTGKTMLARACAAQCGCSFLKLAGPQLVQMYIGDGAKIVRDAFALAKKKAPTIIFIDELDAIGSRRSDGDKH
eukprot:PhF_6_TR14910/c0_g1_i2/m.23297/K03065/PSMC3, RPT5; 26S proteasome regulatory subunit T5